MSANNQEPQVEDWSFLKLFRRSKPNEQSSFAAPAGSADMSELLKDKARLDWLEQGTSEKINSANDFVDWTSGRITRKKIDEAMSPPNDGAMPRAVNNPKI